MVFLSSVTLESLVDRGARNESRSVSLALLSLRGSKREMSSMDSSWMRASSVERCSSRDPLLDGMSVVEGFVFRRERGGGIGPGRGLLEMQKESENPSTSWEKKENS